jgi:hypothetical protein
MVVSLKPIAPLSASAIFVSLSLQSTVQRRVRSGRFWQGTDIKARLRAFALSLT